MMGAGTAARPACPRGLRHGFGVGALQAFVPLHLVQKRLGHARISATAVYAAVVGPEETLFAERFWQSALMDRSAAAARPAELRKNGLQYRRRRRRALKSASDGGLRPRLPYAGCS
jgi:hypothetical protein